MDTRRAKQVIIIRKDLNMRKGKQIAQGAHASMKVLLDSAINNEDTLTIHLDDSALSNWITGLFTKVCVGVNSEKELVDLYKQALEKGLLCSLIVDSGLTEFDGVPTKTAVAIGPAYPEEIDPITGHLKLL